MEKRIVRGYEMYVAVSTEELIALFKANPKAELETSGAITRWLKYDKTHSRIGITDNIYYDWYSLSEFRKYYGSCYWYFFII